MPEDLIGNTSQRLFGGCRLLLCLLLEKATSVKLHESQLASPKNWPYLDALQTVKAHDSTTNEPMMQPVQTQVGMVEKAYFDAFGTTSILFSNTMQPVLAQGHMDSSVLRRTMLSGVVRAEILVFHRDLLFANYAYAVGGDVAKVVDKV